MDGSEERKTKLRLVTNKEQPETSKNEALLGWQPLPQNVKTDDYEASLACPAMDEYIALSSKWSPESFEEFHEAIFLFLLSSVAARRVRIEIGNGDYTELFIALCADSGAYKKTTATRIMTELLQACGLSYLRAPSKSTPQKLIERMTYKVSDNYETMDYDEREHEHCRLAFAGQKSWFFGEFGGLVRSMMKTNGYMNDFRDIIRELDDNQPTYEYETISRKSDVVIKPYLAFLGNMTPMDIQPYISRDNSLWGDGFFARFGFVVPPPDSYKSARFPKGRLVFPAHIVSQIRRWHELLRIPSVSIEEIKKKNEIVGYRISEKPNLQETTYLLNPSVEDAFYGYYEALKAIGVRSGTREMSGNYARFAAKALRIAALLSSFQEATTTPDNQSAFHLDADARTARHIITLSAWHRGQQITERWRMSLHRLMTIGDEPTRMARIQERIEAMLKEQRTLTVRELTQRLHISSAELKPIVEAMTSQEMIVPIGQGKTFGYRLSKVA